MMSIPGPFDAKVCAGDSCQLKTNVADNTCPAGTSPYTIPVPGAVMVSGSAAGWYCTNQPNVDVQVKLPIPRGATVRMGTVSMNFSPSANTTYQHEMALRINNMPVGNAIVPGPASTDKGIQWAIPLEAMLGFEERMSLNIRSFHPYANLAHYIIANTFKVDVVVENVSFNLCAPSQVDAEAKANTKVQAKKTLYANTQGILVQTDINGGASETVPACTVFHTTGRFVTRNNVLYAEVTYATNVVQGITLVLSNAAASQGTGWVSINDLDTSKNAVYERPASCNSAQTTPTPTTPASCPWGGTVVTPEPGTNDPVKCQYTFNADQRHKAAQYAISWAAGACPMFCAFNYYPYVTPSPLYPTPQYGYDCANPSQTDCANFVSQAYLYAGWPMTNDWYCAINPNSNLCEPGHSSQSGWSYAGGPNDPYGYGLPAYIYVQLNGYDLCKEVGRMIKSQDDQYPCGDQEHRILTDEQSKKLASNLRKPFEPGKKPLDENVPRPEMSDYENLRQAWYSLANDFKLAQGDLLYTRAYTTNEKGQQFGLQHVAIIVGWGPVVSTWQQLSDVPINDIKSSYDSAYPVPYVVDHGMQRLLPISGRLPAMNGYKPYYALHWPTYVSDPKTVNPSVLAGSFYFSHIPEHFTIPYDRIWIIDTQTMSLPSIMPAICPVTPIP